MNIKKYKSKNKKLKLLKITKNNKYNRSRNFTRKNYEIGGGNSNSNININREIVTIYNNIDKINQTFNILLPIIPINKIEIHTEANNYIINLKTSIESLGYTFMENDTNYTDDIIINIKYENDKKIYYIENTIKDNIGTKPVIFTRDGNNKGYPLEESIKKYLNNEILFIKKNTQNDGTDNNGFQTYPLYFKKEI